MRFHFKKKIIFVTLAIVFFLCYYFSYIAKNYYILIFDTEDAPIENVWYYGEPRICIENEIPPQVLSAEKNIFFIQLPIVTKQGNMIHLNARRACAIEAAAFHNPSKNVFVLLANSTGFDLSNGYEQTLINVLEKNYSNIYFICIGINKLVAGTIAEDWYRSGKLYNTLYLAYNLSDFLRLVTLIQYGGIYLDTDVIALANFDKFGLNFAAAETPIDVNGAVISFDDGNIGNSIASMAMQDMMDNYNGWLWGKQGPKLITRVLNKICDTEFVNEMTREQCNGFAVFPKNEIYSIHYSERDMFFNQALLKEGRQKLNDSVATHLWNALTKRVKVKKDENVLLNEIGQKNCPKIFGIKEITIW